MSDQIVAGITAFHDSLLTGVQELTCGGGLA
jgi:hypothetical protein